MLGIDRRSLFVFRVGLGVAVIADLCKRALTFEAHYTDAGVLPIAALRPHLPDGLLFQLFLLDGSMAYQAALFVLTGCAAALLVLGWHTRIAAIALTPLVASLQMRNPLVVHTGDALLTSIVFWSMFLPLGLDLSLDARARPAPAGTAQRLASLGTAAILIQIGLFYLFAGLLKHKETEWMSGDAVGVFVGIENYTTAFGRWLQNQPALCEIATYGTLVLEIGGAILLFSPFWTTPLRCVIVAAFAAFHVGLELAIHIGMLELLSLLCLTLFIPSAVWDRIPLRLRAWPAAPAPAPRSAWLRQRPIANATIALLVVLVGVANVHSLGGARLRLPDPLDANGFALNLLQRWSVFTDVAGHRQGWFVVLGELEGGARVEVLTGLRYEGYRRPKDLAAGYRNHNERRYWNLIRLDKHAVFRPHLGDYLCRRWQRAHDTALARLAIFHVAKLPAEPEGSERARGLWVGACARRP